MKDSTRVLSIIEELEKERAQITQELLDSCKVLKAEIDTDLDEGDPQVVQKERTIARIKSVNANIG